jgi:hypothetical protein
VEEIPSKSGTGTVSLITLLVSRLCRLGAAVCKQLEANTAKSLLSQ